MKKSLLLTGAIVLGALSLSMAEDKKSVHGHGAPAPAAVTPPTVTPSPEGAKLYIISPKDGETVKGEVTVKFGLKGMGVCPAGIYLDKTGHHHLLVNMDAKELPSLEIPIPTIEGKCLHYGAGQTETTLNLAPGKHTLQLVLGNYLHIPHTPPMISEKITITVE